MQPPRVPPQQVPPIPVHPSQVGGAAYGQRPPQPKKRISPAVIVIGVVGGLAVVGAMVSSDEDKTKATPEKPASVSTKPKSNAVASTYVETASEKKQRLAEAKRLQAESDAEFKKSQAEVKEVAKRGPKPIPSEWDGITPEVNAFLKANLKDADSLKLVECSVVLPWKGDRWAQRVKYRAKNSFGGYALENRVFFIRNGSVTGVAEL